MRLHRTVLTFCCLISWNFLMLYLFSIKSKNVFMIGGQMLFTTLNTSVVKVWIFLWWILTLLLCFRSSWIVLQLNLYKTTTLETTQKWFFGKGVRLIKHLCKTTTNQIWSIFVVFSFYSHCECFLNKDLLE